MEKDYREGQKIIATIEIEDRGQDFTELDVLENGVILGNSVMFSQGRLSLIGMGFENGMEYHDFKEFVEMGFWEPPKGFVVYMKTTGGKDPLPWKATILKYKILKIKKPIKPNRFIK